MDNKGTVYFFTGLSGAGKTTLGGLFHRRLKAHKANVVLLDGDLIRPVYLEDIGYDETARRKGAQRTFRICKMLSDQGIDVVVCSICMYSDVRDWNRKNIPNYREIYVKTSRETLLRRNQKGLYTTGQNVVGVDLPFDEPKTPDIIIENDGLETPETIVARIEQVFGLVTEKEGDGYEGFDLKRGHGQPHGCADCRAS
jgi:adenylylsulfate kinase